MQRKPKNLIDLAEYRDREWVFADRNHAGRVLAEMLSERLNPDSVILAVPAGGVPVACALAEPIGLEVDVVVVSKITFPWNSESGYGAVSQNGLVWLNDRIVADMRVSKAEIQEGIATTTEKVNRRKQAFRGKRPSLDLGGRSAVIVDDGLASGTTMRVAIETVARMKTTSITLAVPTGQLDSIRRISPKVERIYCANVRSQARFAVAAAYQNWSDVPESEAIDMMARHYRIT